MGKLTTYLMIMGGLMLLFYFGGLLQDCTQPDNTPCEGDEECLCSGKTASSKLLNAMLQPENTRELTVVQKALLVMASVGALFVIAATARFIDVKLALKSSFAVFLLTLGWDFFAVFSIIWRVHKVFALLLFSPVMLLYLVTIIEWWSS